MNRSPKGFTLIELIVAIGIILILGTITVLGVRSMMQSSRASSTRVALQAADSIYDEWRRSAGVNARTPSQAWPQSILPGSFNHDDPNNYRADKAVRLTRGMIFRMNQLPAIRKAIQALPADRLWTLPAATGVAADPLARPQGYYADIDNFAFDPSTHTRLDDKTVRECVAAGRFYISAYVQPTTDYPAAVAPGAAAWTTFWLETNHQTPVIVDAWNNPVLFLPACGFVVGTQIYTSHGVYALPANGNIHWVDTASYTAGEFVIFAGGDGVFHLYRCLTDHAASDANAPNISTGNWEQIPTRPFFASAGPDGIFYDPADPESIQDNLYSYER